MSTLSFLLLFAAVMNGPDATKKLRELGCHAYIAGVTGNLLAEDVGIFKSSGADYVLPKPTTLSSIEASWRLHESTCRHNAAATAKRVKPADFVV